MRIYQIPVVLEAIERQQQGTVRPRYLLLGIRGGSMAGAIREANHAAMAMAQ
jgi:hypothetical protein